MRQSLIYNLLISSKLEFIVEYNGSIDYINIKTKLLCQMENINHIITNET